MDTRENEALRTRETSRLIASDKVEGTAVRNAQGDNLGEIQRVMIDKYTGKVAYAVMSFGGFLGLGRQHHALPWGVLAYNENYDAYVVDLTPEQLEGAPAYDYENAETHWHDREWDQRMHDYYRIPPYWV